MSDDLTKETEGTEGKLPAVPPKPVLRKELPEDVIKYLREAYPSRVNGAGIRQSDRVDYITEERSFMDDQDVRDAGLEALGLLWFIRLKMSEDLGWGLDMSGRNYEKLLMSLYYDLNVTPEHLNDLCSKLVEKGIIKGVRGSDGKTYWTTMQQFYNYEYKNWTRIKNNIASRKRNKKKGSNDEKKTA